MTIPSSGRYACRRFLGRIGVSRSLIVLTTCGSVRDAEALAEALVEQRLAACVNVLPGIASIYRWDNRVQRDRESFLVINAAAEKFDVVERTMQALSP